MDEASDRRTTLILVLTHGRACEELVNSAKMILGEAEGVVAVPLLPSDDPTSYESRINKVLAKCGGRALILTDLLGGTPSNCAAALSRDHAIDAISGVNLPMLIEALNLRPVLGGKALVRALIDSSRSGIRDIFEGLGPWMGDRRRSE